jgi:parallel beta-helix repeat protein
MASMLAMVVVLTATSSSYARDPLQVPDPYESIPAALAVAYAESSDVVIVTNSGTYTDAFTMKDGVPVQAEEGETPTIDPGTGSTYAVDWPSGAGSNTILHGFTVRGGSTAIIRLRGDGVVDSCLVQSESSDAPVGILFEGSGEVLDCSVDMNSGGGADIGIQASGTGTATRNMITVYQGRGFYASSGSPTLTESTIQVTGGQGTNYAVLFGVSSTAPSIDNCLVLCPNGYGIDLEKGTADQCTVDDTGTGVVFYKTTAFEPPAVQNCIAVGDNYGFYALGLGAEGAYNCIAPGANGFYGGAQGTGSVNEDPLFCDAGSGEYTLRIDSWGNPENNGSGQIGAFPVACAYGELVRSTTVGEDTEVLVLSDVLVPSSTSLTLEAGVVFSFDDYDEDNLGDHGTKVELFVDNGGSLTVSGRSGNPVQFVSGDETAGDWYGITLENNVTAAIDTALVYYSSYGIVNKSGETTAIRGCTFENNETYDIVIGYSGSPDNLNDATVSGNTLTVGTGAGIHLETSYISGTVIEDNAITGNSSSYDGIQFAQFTPGTTPTIEGNTITGFSAGAGIKVSADAVIINNAISGCQKGINVIDGTPEIGQTSGGTNNILDNTNGIYVDGSSSSPSVRKNYFNSNTYGVQVKSGGAPDIGTDGSHKGNNSIANSDTYCIWNRNPSGTVQAYGNYLGACSGGNPPTCWSGSVNAGGWLCTDPLDLNVPVALVTPVGLRMLGASPNPSGGAGVIHFRLDAGFGTVAVAVFDVAGRLVREVGRFDAGPGENRVRWDGLDARGRRVDSGLYFVRVVVEGADVVATTKMLVSR